MNIHLHQFPWAHTHTTRSREKMAREGCSHSHEGPSYKVHNHPYTGIYRYTYIMHKAITQSRKIKQTLLMSQGYGLVSYKKCKTDIAIPREHGLSKVQEKIKSTWRGETLIHFFREEAKRKGERCNHSRRPGLLIY